MMNSFALHLPEERGIFRWTLAALMIVMAHAAIVAAVALWYARSRPVEPNILPAIAVTLAPVESSSPEIQDQDIAVGPTMQQAEAAPPEPPKVEEKQPEPVVQLPPPQQEAAVTLPKAEKEVEEPKPVPEPPAPETRAPPKSDRIG